MSLDSKLPLPVKLHKFTLNYVENLKKVVVMAQFNKLIYKIFTIFMLNIFINISTAFLTTKDFCLSLTFWVHLKGLCLKITVLNIE